MAISYTPTDIRGKAYEPVIEEILFANDTVEKNLVAFETDVKSDTIFTENDNTATMQAFSSGVPTSSGTLGLTDTLVSPVKVMYYQEFDPNTLRSSRFKRDMAAGAWNVESNEFATRVLGSYGRLISEDLQAKFWSNATSATKTAVAAGANTTAEKAYVAGLTAGQFDGVITRMIFNNGAVGGRVNVVGVAITSATIAAEYARAYAAVPSRVLFGAVKPYIYAPYSHKQFINIFNVSATYRDLFSVQADGRYFYNGVEIVFVPLAENRMIVARPDYIVWCTDLLSDINMLKIDKIALNREDMFVKNVMTIFAHVLNQSMNVLYL
jgi:hypothetical protein